VRRAGTPGGASRGDDGSAVPRRRDSRRGQVLHGATDGWTPATRLLRYDGAQRLSAAAAPPWHRASTVIDMSEPEEMRVIDWPGPA